MENRNWVPAEAEMYVVNTVSRASLEPNRPLLHSIQSGNWSRSTWSTQRLERLLILLDLVYAASRADIYRARPGLRSVKSGYW